LAFLNSFGFFFIFENRPKKIWLFGLFNQFNFDVGLEDLKMIVADL